jgi:ribonuclease P protein component
VLPQPNRLRRRADFVRVTRTGRRCTRGTLTTYLLEPGDDRPGGSDQPRVGFVVSRALGGAVVRNAVTRRLRVVARDRLDRLPVGATVVLRALPSAASAGAAELAADLDACLDRLLGRAAVTS